MKALDSLFSAWKLLLACFVVMMFK